MEASGSLSLQAGEAEEGHNGYSDGDDFFTALGCDLTKVDYQSLPSPPTMLFETIDPDFGRKVCQEYSLSCLRDKWRVAKYGREAKKSRRGFTPSPVRELYRAKQEYLAALDELSTDDSYFDDSRRASNAGTPAPELDNDVTKTFPHHAAKPTSPLSPPGPLHEQPVSLPVNIQSNPVLPLSPSPSVSPKALNAKTQDIISKLQARSKRRRASADEDWGVEGEQPSSVQTSKDLAQFKRRKYGHTCDNLPLQPQEPNIP